VNRREGEFLPRTTRTNANENKGEGGNRVGEQANADGEESESGHGVLV